MENKLLNYSKTQIPVIVSSPSPNYEIMQSLLSKTSDLPPAPPISLPSSSSSKSPAKTDASLQKRSMTKKQEQSFIRNTINLINNHSSRTIAKDLVLSAAKKHKAANRANRNLLIAQNSHLVSPESLTNRRRAPPATSPVTPTKFVPPTQQQHQQLSPDPTNNHLTYFTIESNSSQLDVELLNVERSASLTAASNTVFTWLEHNYNEPTVIADPEVVPIVQSLPYQVEKPAPQESDNLTVCQQQPTFPALTSQTNPESADESSLLNLNRMLSCYCLLERDCFTNHPQLKLRCSVCSTQFENLSRLIDHKHANKSCMNNVLSDISQHGNSSSSVRFAGASGHDHVELFLVQIEDQDLDESLLDPPKSNPENQGKPTRAKSSRPKKGKNLRNKKKIDYQDSSLEEDELEDMVINKVDREKTNRKLNVENASEDNQAVTSSKCGQVESDTGEKPRLRRKYEKRKKFSDSNLICPKCKRVCLTKAELQVHLHKHEGNGPDCWECGKKCTTFSNLTSHFLVHTGEKPFSCQFCHKVFTQISHLTRHLRLHTGERPFICNLCGKTYKDYSYFKVHLRIHRGERIYKCEYCKKQFYDASYYKKHVRLHTGEKPYMCTICGRQFHRSDYLKLHSFTHTKERPFNCHICGKGFIMNHNLKQHLKQHEMRGDNGSSNEENIGEQSTTSNQEMPTTSVVYETTSCSNNMNEEEDEEEFTAETTDINKNTAANSIVHLFNPNDILSSTAYLCEEDLANLESTFVSNL